jgi:hypothetical protein
MSAVLDAVALTPSSTNAAAAALATGATTTGPLAAGAARMSLGRCRPPMVSPLVPPGRGCLSFYAEEEQEEELEEEKETVERAYDDDEAACSSASVGRCWSP